MAEDKKKKKDTRRSRFTENYDDAIEIIKEDKDSKSVEQPVEDD